MTCERLSLEHTLFGLAGTMTALSVALAVLASPWFLLLAVFVAVNQLLFAFTGECGASLVLRRTPCFSREMAP
jgi:hypothetical protein